MAAGAPARRLEWAAGALDAYLSTVARIAADDPFTARQFVERVQQCLAAIVAHPLIGTPATRRGAEVRLTFESLPLLLRNLTPARRALLEDLKRHGPLSINELA